MIRIIISPDAIKKEGLDKVTKSIIRRLHKYTNETHCEVLFLKGIEKGDIHYILRHILRVLDMGLTIVTQVNTEDFKKDVGIQGNEVEVTLRVT